MMMQQDIEMYHKNTNTPMRVRSSDLNEELGMVKNQEKKIEKGKI